MHLMEPWVAWAVLAAVLIIGEIFVAGFFVLFFGVGAIPASIIAYFFPKAYVWQLVVFFAVSGILLAFGRRIALRLTFNTPSDVGANRMIGKVGLVLKEIDVKTASGIVRVDREEWRAESESGETIPADKWVEVVRIDGTRIIVKEKKGN